MTTSKGTIQGYNGVAAVDKKHQIIVDAQAFGEGQEHHTLAPVIECIDARLKRLGICENIYASGTIVTADTGFANEANMKYLYEHNINAYVPDNQFRRRDPKFAAQKQKYGKRHQDTKKNPNTSTHARNVIPASKFSFDPSTRTCICPAGESLTFHGDKLSPSGRPKAFFEGRLMQCRNCDLKQQCMKTQVQQIIEKVPVDKCLSCLISVMKKTTPRG